MLATAYLDRLESDPSTVDQMLKNSLQYYTTAPPNLRPYFPDIKVLQFEDGSVASEINGVWAEFASMTEHDDTLNQIIASYQRNAPK